MNNVVIYKLQFIPNKNFIIDDFLVRIFLGKINFSEQKYFVLSKEPMTSNLPIDNIVGRIKKISYVEGEFFAEFEVFEGLNKEKTIYLIENKLILINWLISGTVSYKDVDFISKFCYFYKYKRACVDSISSLFCFFLEPIEK